MMWRKTALCVASRTRFGAFPNKNALNRIILHLWLAFGELLAYNHIKPRDGAKQTLTPYGAER